ncbi:MAG TPA: acylneuraminate cytidylyltransferase family protein [Rhizomicrobium sp.]|jgi:N-acylneuraminate cytidylyltransferase
MKILAIIPARGGSKAIPRKNIIDFGGKPVLAWSVEQALASTRINRVVVSTDDDEIADVARRYRAEVIVRPPELSGDTASSESALVHVLDTLATQENYVPDLVVFLQATSPLRGEGDLDKAIAQLECEQADTLVSAGPFHGFVWEILDGKARPLTYDPLNRPRRQDIKAEYVVENGSFFVFKPEILRTLNSRLGGKISIYRQDLIDSFEINETEDMPLLLAMLRLKGQG